MQIKSEKGLNPFLEAFAAELEPISSLPANSMRLYANALAKSAKLFAVFAEHVTSLGHIQLVGQLRALGNPISVLKIARPLFLQAKRLLGSLELVLKFINLAAQFTRFGR